MNLKTVMGVIGIVSLVLLSGCGNKDPLKNIKSVALVGLSYGIRVDSVDDSGTSGGLDVMTAGKVLSKIGKKKVATDPSLEDVLLGIDPELQAYFDSIVEELKAMVESEGVEVLVADQFADNPSFASLKKDKTDSVWKKMTRDSYSPEPYASASYPHKKDVLKQLAQDLGVDAVMTVKLGVVKKKNKKMLLDSVQMGIRSQFGLIDKNGKTLMNKGFVTTVFGKDEVDANALIFGANSLFQITPNNHYEFILIKEKYMAKMHRKLRRKS